MKHCKPLPPLPDIFQDSPVLWLRCIQGGHFIVCFYGEEWLSYEKFARCLRMEVFIFRRKFANYAKELGDDNLMILVSFRLANDLVDSVNVPYSFFL